MTKIVITGALGHIGSRLIRELPLSFPGVEIVMVDSLRTQRYCSLFGLPREGRYSFLEADVRALDLEQLLADAFLVVHLAAITDAEGTMDRAREVEQNNLTSTIRVAEACANVGARLFMVSTTSVYGTQAAVVDEDCSEEDLKPQSPYAATKLEEERVVRRLTEKQALRAGIFRFGTIVGPSEGMRFHTAVNRFCWQAALGLPLTVWKTAYDQKRPYLELVDACRAIEHVIRKDLFDGLTYNVLTQNCTVGEIVQHIQAFVPHVRVELVDSERMNQLSYEVRDARFRQTGFLPLGCLRDSILSELSLLNARIGLLQSS